MLISTSSTGFLHDPRSGGNPGPAANSAKPDGDGHRACPMTMANMACHHSPAAGRSWRSAVPAPGALTATEVRGRVIWLDPSIARSRHLGGIRRRRTRSAAEVQGNDSEPTTEGHHPARSAAGARALTRRRHLAGCGPTRMLVIEACPAWSVTSSCGACGHVLAWARTGRPGVRQRTLTRAGRTCWLVPKRVSGDGCGAAV